MKIARLDGFEPYQAKGHYGMVALRVHGKDTCDSEILTMGLSYFLPGGGAERSTVATGTEVIYYVMEGELTLTTDTEQTVLKAGDSVFFKAGDSRAVRNETNRPATMLVVAGKNL